MNTKKCSGCKEEKNIDQFNKKEKRKDGTQTYQPFCRECNKIASRKYYKENGKEHKKLVAKRNKILDKRIRVYVQTVKAIEKCQICGEDDPRCLDFHHPNKDKEHDISTLTKYKDVKKLKEEMEKCEVICSNCHRKLHWKLYIDIPCIQSEPEEINLSITNNEIRKQLPD